MDGIRSAYRILGLGPGADAAAVESAYRNLIKRYHPDRQGGDAVKAAEINRAYQQISGHRRLPAVRRGTYVMPPRRSRRSRGAGLHLLAGTLLLGLAAFVLIWSSLDLLVRGTSKAFPPLQPAMGAVVPPPLSTETVEQPLDREMIEMAAYSAEALFQKGEYDRLSNRSHRCHDQLRKEPSMTRLDQCVAFDEAASLLTRGEVSQESGPFGTAAVTRRQLNAAQLFTDDYLLLESRLDRIRALVEFSLAPPEPSTVPANGNAPMPNY